MKINRNIHDSSFSDRLPVHSPDEGMWDRIASGLDQLDARQAYEEKLAGLPVHRPDSGTWALILQRMQRAKAFRIGTYASLAAAASLALLFTIFRTTEPTGKEPATATLSQQLNKTIEPSATSQHPAGNLTEKITSPGSLASIPANHTSPGRHPSDNRSETYLSVNQTENTIEFRLAAPLIQVFEYATGRYDLPVAKRGLIQSPGKTAVVPLPVYALQEPVRYYSPDPYDPMKKKDSRFSLAANYLPESLENGTGTSLFHNFGLMASVGNEKTRFNSSIGMVYNSEHRVYDVNYTQFIAITVPNPGSGVDSTAIVEASGASQLEGTERHQYITYDMGIGKRLFSKGRITTWLNTGAGFAVRLDNSSLREETIKTISSHNNSQVNQMDLEIPDYNGMNFSLVTGLDINYRVLKRLSVSLAPTSRIYIKPVLEKNGFPTDSFSLGFRSGIKYDF